MGGLLRPVWVFSEDFGGFGNHFRDQLVLEGWTTKQKGHKDAAKPTPLQIKKRVGPGRGENQKTLAMGDRDTFSSSEKKVEPKTA